MSEASPLFTVAAIFTDHLLLQRGMPVPVWGTGPEGGRVTVSFRGRTADAAVAGGRWTAALPAMSASGEPAPLTIAFPGAAQADIVLADVLVGDVWLAGGQSNMVQPLLVTEGGVEAAAEANLPDCRFFTVPRRPFPDARVPGWDFIGTYSDDAAWQACSPDTALLFSGIGFHFAALMQRSQGVPIGIISCNWGGTPAQAWMSESALAGDPELAPLLDAFRRHVAEQDADGYELAHDRYIADMHRLIEERGDIARRVRTLGLEGYRGWIAGHPLVWPEQPYGPKHPERPCGLFDTMLRTVIPYAVRGVLWYQGESNAGDGERLPLYGRLLAALIRCWREEWERPELPFLIVQLAGFMPPERPYGDNWSAIREAQQTVADELPHAALVVAMDTGERSDIHPVDKRTVAERLALAARAVAHGENARHEGPRFRGLAVVGGRAMLAFDPDGEPPAPTGAPLAGFQVCGADGHFFPADARYAGGHVEAAAPEVAEPVAVRYAWGNFPSWSVVGMNGIPAAPFRTDDYRIQ